MATKVTVESIKALNKRIESINTTRTRTETKIDMLKKDLAEKLADYKKKYGVDLEGKSFKETVKLINSEAKSTADAVQKEYELKEQVVECIESGDIKKASELLGIKTEEESEVEEVEEAEEPTEVVDEPAKTSQHKKVVPEGMSAVDEMIAEDDKGKEDDSDEIIVDDDIKIDDTDDLKVEDDDDSDDPFGFGFGKMLKGTDF